MRVFGHTHYSSIAISTLALTTILLLLLILQTNAPNGFSILYLPFSLSTSSSSSSSSSTPPPLSRAEEKRQRAQKRLSDAVDQVLASTPISSSDHGSKPIEISLVEKGLASARALITSESEASFSDETQNDAVSSAPFPSLQLRVQQQDGPDNYIYVPSIYNNALAFHRSYLLMEKMFKIFVYEEGERPLFHDGPCKNIYSIEGLFINLMEKDDRFKTRDPHRAHAFFLPFSVVMIIEHLFDPVVRDKAVLERTVVDYIRTISTKYPYWNRSIGTDHFMLSCHDWGPRATWYHPLLYFHSIRVLCNANTSEHFNPKKDASIPEINFPTGDITSHLLQEALPPLNRSILGFFAGRMHGRIRPALFHHWKEKDQDLQIYEHLPEGTSYDTMMRSSKFCICPSGFEVASPRIVEAIYVGCVPVLISQDYVLPFSDVLNWVSFSVRVSVEDIPDLKRVLLEISEERYLRLHENVKRVKRHFVVNDPPKRYDVFHMIVHSIWLRRLNVHINGG